MISDNVVTKDGIRIAFDHYKNGHAMLVVIAPGFFNSKDALLIKDLANGLAGQYDVIAMDFRGHGKSGGLFYWTSKEYLDLLAIVDQFKDQYMSIGVIGFSLGAATAIIAASKTDAIKAIVAVSAPSDFSKIEYRLWELNVENDIRYSLLSKGRIGKGVRPGPFWYKKEKPIDVVGKLHQPILFIHGTDDWVVKPWHSKTLFDQAKSLKSIETIQYGPHAEYLMRDYSKEVLKFIRDWFK